VLLVLPAVWIARRRFTLYAVRYPVYNGRCDGPRLRVQLPSQLLSATTAATRPQGLRPWVLCWLLFWLMHLDVFLPLSLASGHNINYVLVPPNIGLLRGLAGLWYRPAVGFITGASAAAARAECWKGQSHCAGHAAQCEWQP
jgi:hypothetical protein